MPVFCPAKSRSVRSNRLAYFLKEQNYTTRTLHAEMDYATSAYTRVKVPNINYIKYLVRTTINNRTLSFAVAK